MSFLQRPHPHAGICNIKFAIFIQQWIVFFTECPKCKSLIFLFPLATCFFFFFYKEKWCVTGLMQAGGVQFTHGTSLQFSGKRSNSLLLCRFVSSLQAADLFMLGTRKSCTSSLQKTGFVFTLFPSCLLLLPTILRETAVWTIIGSCRSVCVNWPGRWMEVLFGGPAGELGIAAD